MNRNDRRPETQFALSLAHDKAAHHAEAVTWMERAHAQFVALELHTSATDTKAWLDTHGNDLHRYGIQD